MARDASQNFWEQASARLASRINLALWLEAFGPAAFALGSAAAVALYALRRTAGAPAQAWIALLAGLAVAAGVARWRTRERRYRAADARVLLESALRLDARLSAAADGVTPWPARADLPAVVRWKSLAAPGWILGALALLAAATWAPLPAGSRAVRRPVEKPPALAQTEAMLQELAKLDVADPASLEKLVAQTRELGGATPEEQYTHSALEAADTLRDQTMAAVQELAHDYESASGALAPLEAGGNGTDANGTKGAGDQLSLALDGLRTGRLAGNRELTDQLSAAKAGGSGLTRDQLRQLRAQLGQAGAQARGVMGAAGAGARIADHRAEGPDGEGPGQGGVNRGRGDAPLTMSEAGVPDNPGRMQEVNSADFSRASLGDFAGMGESTAPRSDPTKATGPGSAGKVNGAARGGEAVWIDRLSPADRAVLRDLFK